MRSLLKYLKPYRKEAILAPLFKLFEACVDLFIPIVIASMIDSGVAQGDDAWILTCGMILTTLALLGLAAAFTAQYFAASAAIGFASLARRRLFHRVNLLSFAQLDRFGADSIATRMTNDAGQVQTGLNLALRLMMRSPFIVFGAVVGAFCVDPVAACVFVVALPILTLIAVAIMRAAIPLYRRLQTELDGLARATRENLVGARVVRAFNLEDSEARAFRERNRRLSHAQRFVGVVSGTTNPATQTAVNLAIAALVLTCGRRVNVGALTQGETAALLAYMSQILVELIKMANLVVQTNRAIACGDRVAEVLNAPFETTDGSREVVVSKDGIAVSFEHATFQYEGTIAPALIDASFEARVGETIGIVGGAGSGKTTLVNLIARFYDVGSGSVRVFGSDVREYSRSSLRDAIAFVPQKTSLFKGSVASNLRWGNAYASDDELRSALETAQAWNFVESKPGGLAYELEPNGRNLSGGQKQRLTIARALVKHAPILILDDSTSALDFATDARLRKAVRETTPASTTTFVVSQRASSVLGADLILVLEDGKIVGKGKHSELLASNDAYREIYYAQFPQDDAGLIADAQGASERDARSDEI